MRYIFCYRFFFLVFYFALVLCFFYCSFFFCFCLSLFRFSFTLFLFLFARRVFFFQILELSLFSIYVFLRISKCGEARSRSYKSSNYKRSDY